MSVADMGTPKQDLDIHNYGHLKRVEGVMSDEHLVTMNLDAEKQTSSSNSRTNGNTRTEDRILLGHNADKRYYGKRGRSKGWIGCICDGKVATVLSLVAIASVSHIYFTRENLNMLEPVTTTEAVHGEASKLQGLPGGKICGRFKLNQTYFDNSGRRNISWVPVTHANNEIISDPTGPCIIVPESGTYGIFSVITFAVGQNDPVKRLVHFLRLRNQQEGEHPFQRKIFAVPSPENRNNPEIIPSTLISFSSLNARGKICADTPNKEFVYISALDNTINVFKV